MNKKKDSKGYGLAEVAGGVVGFLGTIRIGNNIAINSQIREHGFSSLQNWQSEINSLEEIYRSIRDNYPSREACNKARSEAKERLLEIEDLNIPDNNKALIVKGSAVAAAVLTAVAINYFRNNDATSQNYPQSTIKSEGITYDDKVLETTSKEKAV